MYMNKFATLMRAYSNILGSRDTDDNYSVEFRHKIKRTIG